MNFELIFVRCVWSTSGLIDHMCMSNFQALFVERFYFLGDWEDNYCDLTLDKMVAEVRNRTGRDIEKKIKTPSDIDELRAQLENLAPTRDGGFIQQNKEAVKPNIFRRVFSAIKGK